MPWATSHSGSDSKSCRPPPRSGSAGSEARAGAAAPAPQHPASGTGGVVQAEALKQILGVIDKKLWNLEKKKGKRDDYQERMNKGERLNPDQLDAVSKYQEVTNNLEFAKELQRSFIAVSETFKIVLELQYVLDKLADDEVRTDLKQGLNGVPILSEEELSLLDEFYKLVDAEQDLSLWLKEQYEHEKSVCGTTYKSNYFDSTHNHQNRLCEEEEAVSAPAVKTRSLKLNLSQQKNTLSKVKLNQQCTYIPIVAETQFSNGEKVEEWTVETAEVAASPSVPEPQALTPVAQAGPLVRRQREQDLMAQMQQPYNFIQDSVLGFENQTLDPAIVSAQPMNPAQNMHMPQLACPPVHSESRLAQPSQVSVQPEATQVPLVSSTSEGYTASQPLYQPSHATEQRPRKEPIDQFQATISLNADQITASLFLLDASHSGINVNAAPFQSMQMVFDVNAPVPPVNEPETLKQQNQYQSSYNQSFSSQPHQVEQTELQQEQLLTVVGPYHGSQGHPHQVTGNHQQHPPQQNIGFPRNLSGVSCGGSCSAKVLMNGYGGPTNGLRGGSDGYRPSLPNFSAPRDYSGYQRDGYQQNFNHGGPPGPNKGMSQMNMQQVN
uniref:Caprin-1 n=1 Tax=Chinchilla lanigera TaxID=34839 RepID=A0A8C2V9R7_CHILA